MQKDTALVQKPQSVSAVVRHLQGRHMLRPVPKRVKKKTTATVCTCENRGKLRLSWAFLYRALLGHLDYCRSVLLD